MIGIIVASVLFGLFLAGAAVWYLLISLFDEFAMHWTRSYNLDADKLLVREFEQGEGRPWILRTVFYKTFLPLLSDWTSVAYLSNLFKNSQGEKLLRQALHDLNKRPDFLEVKFNDSLPGFNRQAFRNGHFEVFLRFNRIEGDFYVVNIKWTRIYRQEHRITARNVQQINREELANYSAKATGYLAFNASASTAARALLIRTVVHLWRESVVYFLDGTMIVFVFQGKSVRQVESTAGAFIKKLRLGGFSLRNSLLYNGSAFIASERGHLPNKQVNSLQVLEFLISVSINQNRDFISINEYHISSAEYKTFYDALKLFKGIVQEKSFGLEMKPVRHYPDGKAWMSFIKPEIKGISSALMSKILSNFNHHDALVDATATRAVQEKTLKNAFLDVNLDWLAANRTLLRNKQIVYVIGLSAYNDEELLKSTLDFLNAAGLPFGFRLPYHDGEIEKLINLYAPQYIIIDRSLVGDDGVFSSSEFISLLSVANYSEIKNSVVVYEGLPLYLNESIAKKVALRYYY